MLGILWNCINITLSSKKNDVEMSVFNKDMVCLTRGVIYSCSATIKPWDLKGTALGFSFIGYKLNGLEGFISSIPSITKVPWVHGPLVWKWLTCDTCSRALCILEAQQAHHPCTPTNSLFLTGGLLTVLVPTQVSHCFLITAWGESLSLPWHAPI